MMMEISATHLNNNNDLKCLPGIQIKPREQYHRDVSEALAHVRYPHQFSEKIDSRREKQDN